LVRGITVGNFAFAASSAVIHSRSNIPSITYLKRFSRRTPFSSERDGQVRFY